ncbi:MAG: transposase [Cetobacterium sp.]
MLENSYTKKIPKNALFHSDRGAQFTSLEYKETPERLGVTHSMSRVGKCIDNGPMEGFFGNVKSEKYYLKNFYNEDRLQKNLGNLSPLIYRKSNE